MELVGVWPQDCMWGAERSLCISHFWHCRAGAEDALNVPFGCTADVGQQELEPVPDSLLPLLQFLCCLATLGLPQLAYLCPYTFKECSEHLYLCLHRISNLLPGLIPLVSESLISLLFIIDELCSLRKRPPVKDKK